MSKHKLYVWGLICSVCLTLAAFIPVFSHVQSNHLDFSHSFLTYWILALAVVQLCVQMIFFLHLGKGKNGKWDLVIFLSTISIVLILVIGSVWIMNNLNYNMTPDQINAYMVSQ